tara:strand:+ start:3121 stop:3363 length:243 start_codon:yes stop_codon:yes gene_type:complete
LPDEWAESGSRGFITLSLQNNPACGSAQSVSLRVVKPDPMIQIDTELIAVGDTKVIDPASQILADLEVLIAYRHAPVAVR